MNIKIFIYFTILGIALLVSGGMLGFKILPDIVVRKIWEKSILKENNSQWGTFVKFPFPFTFKIYFFNITNVEGVLNGDVPLVKEIGPYVYTESKWKSDIEWDSEDILSYRENTRFHFDKEASGKYSDSDTITILNVPLNSVIQTVEATSSAVLPALNTVLPFIFYGYNNIFMTITVQEYLFSGIEICNKDNFAKASPSTKFTLKVICSQLNAKAKESTSMRITNNSILFSNFYYKNSTPGGLMSINSGEDIKEDVGKLIRFNQQNFIKTWKGDKSSCNTIKGLVQFPPFPKPQTPLQTFVEDICRIITLLYNKKENFKGIDGYKYVTEENSFSSYGENSCYCLDESKGLNGSYNCPDGLIDLTNCAGAPVYVSFPHLLLVNEEIKNSVRGLHPNQEKHTSYVVLEVNSGLPLKLSRKVQFNMFIRPIPDIEITENITKAIVPIFWIEESFELPDEYITLLRHTLIDNLKKLEIFKWGLIIVGLFTVLIPVGCMLYYLK